MPRSCRLDLPGIAQHVVQCGNDRRPCFFTEIDYIRYLQDLRDITRREGCAVHAYVPMTNHVHLLMTPRAAGGIGRTMQALGRRYARYVNDRYCRTGTLWEGRYKASLIVDNRYLLQCQRYIELNPVRAKMVADPVDYRWSSFRHHALGVLDPMITPHPVMQNLGSTPHERQQNYRKFVMQAIDPEETDTIRRHLQHQHIYGPDRFRQAIEAQLGRKTGPKKIGRPKKPEAKTSDLLESRLWPLFWCVGIPDSLPSIFRPRKCIILTHRKIFLGTNDATFCGATLLEERPMRILLFLVLTALVSVDAFGVPIYWNTWASSSSGSLTAGASTVAVTFSTANGHAEIAGYPSWLPSNTFADGTLVNNGPVAANGIMQLSGGTTALNTLTFSTPIVNPVFSIWSLGSAGAQASFDFIGLTPVFVAGGTNAEYGGSAISVSGNTVYGREGNGTIEFMGTFSSFQWTNPLYEYWYGFNVGVADVGTTTPVPEPGQALLFSLGVGLLIGFRTLARMKPHSVART